MSKRLLKFSQPSCTPCKILSNYLESKNVKYEEINVFEDVEFAAKYGITGGLPVMILLDDEEVIARTTGFNPGNTSEVDELLSQIN